MAGTVRTLYLTQLKTSSQTFIYGDANGDNIVNVQDIIVLVNYILNGGDDQWAEDNGYNLAAMDINQDGIINILDVVATVDFIVNGG